MPRRTLLGLIAAMIVLAVPTAVAAEPYEHATQPTAVGTGGAAATVDSVATTAATDVLRQGGNAVDAAVAAAAVLGVTEPFSCGIGGGGFMVIRTPDGEVTTIDSREKAPAAMRPTSFLENGTPLPFDDARYSGLSGGVPGTVAGWDRALRQYGSWSLRRALERGIDVAREGFVIDQTFHDQALGNRDFFDDVTSSEALYLDPDGTPHDPKTIQRNPDMARAYERIGELGVKGFYRGAIADALVGAVQDPPLTADANHRWRPGLMTLRDLRDYSARERKPTQVEYRGLDVFGMGPPSSGGSTDGEALNILELESLSSMDRIHQLHWFLEASRFSFADRNAYLGDPAFFDVPLRGLLSDSFAAERHALIKRETAATSPVTPGDPYPYDDQPAAAGASGFFDPRQSTTHLTVADDAGTVVSYTFTIESTGGNGIVVPGWGFLVNNELTDFNFDSLTHPNRAEGGKRPRSSMAPTIVTKDGAPFLATGSPGGSMIITTVLQVLMERIDAGKTLPQAIAEPRASQRNTLATAAEPAFRAAYEAGLSTLGHSFSTSAEIGAVTGIEFLSGGGLLAAAEPKRRGGGSAQVVISSP
jgi:gamma-glutamyltranspeptidase / glutathione hydrolase